MADDEIIAGRVAAPSPSRRPTSRIQGRHIQTGGASTGYAHTASDKIVAGRVAAESPSWRPASCVRGRSERFSGTIKRHTVKIRYNLLPLPFTPWIWQLQQLRQRLNPQRRIPSSGRYGRSVHTASNASGARSVVAPAYASMACGATVARSVVAPAYASMTCGANVARNVAAPASACTASGAPIAGIVVAQASASTTSYANIAPSVRTSHAQLKAVHSSATVSVQPESY